MTVQVATTGTQTATITTEHTLAQDSGANSFQASIDATNMVNGDILEVRAYRIINSTARQIDCCYYSNAQANALIQMGPYASAGVTNGFKFTLKQTAGTGRSFDWEVLKDSGAAAANLTQILGTALTETAGQIAAAFKKLFDVASPVLTATSINQTGDNYARIGAAGAGLTALGDARIANLDTTVSSRLAASGYTAPLDAAGTRTAVGLASANLDTQLSAINSKTTNLPSDPADASVVAGLIAGVDAKVDTIDTVVDAIKVTTDKVDDTLEDDLGTFRFTANALEQAPSGIGVGGATAQEIWEYDISAINTAGMAGTQVNAIKAKTDNLPSDPADASVVAGLIGAVETKVDTVDTVVDAIKAKTDNLPSDPADASVVAGLISAVETKVDGVKTKTDQLAFGVAGKVNANTQYMNGAQIQGNGSSGDLWRGV